MLHKEPEEGSGIYAKLLGSGFLKQVYRASCGELEPYSRQTVELEAPFCRACLLGVSRD